MMQYEWDETKNIQNLPRVSEKDWMELRDRAGRISDDDIDYTDAPATEDFSAFKRWNDPALFRPIKQDIHIKIDADILAWLKSGGKGYQTRINSILRNAMAAGSMPARLVRDQEMRTNPQ